MTPKITNKFLKQIDNLKVADGTTANSLYAQSYEIGYNAGIYGWNYSLYYHQSGFHWVTGYRLPSFCDYLERVVINR